MTLRTILACLTSTASAPSVLKAAAILARRDNAHLIGLFVTEPLVVYPSIAMHIPDAVYEDFLASQRAQAQEIRKIFDVHTHAEDFPSEWRQMSSESGSIADSSVQSGRSADLVVIPQEVDGETRPAIENMQERIIRQSGRPVLVVPRDFDAATIGDTVVLGWSETREATRAVHDMLMVARPDANVRILRIGKPPGNTLADHSANDLATALARHGPKVEVVHRTKNGTTIPEIMRHEAFEAGADMLATGAFGHSRTYDFVIGAATRALLNEATLPVLFSK